MCVCGGGGGHSDCNASLSQPNVQKNSRAPVKGRVGGLKSEKKKIIIARPGGGGGGGVLSFFFIRRLGPSI